METFLTCHASQRQPHVEFAGAEVRQVSTRGIQKCCQQVNLAFHRSGKSFTPMPYLHAVTGAAEDLAVRGTGA